MPRRLLAPLLAVSLLAVSACGEARSASDEAACSTEADCAKLYRTALARLHGCLAERLRAGYVGPGGQPPPSCDALKAEAERWAAAVNRIRGRKQQEADEAQGGGFEVPPLPPATP